MLDPADQADRERNRHRVVAARLGLERACEPARDVREAERREHRGGIGRRDDRPQQERFEPREVEERLRENPSDERCHYHADRAQEARGHGDLPQPPPRGLEAALVEDQPEPDRARLARELSVVEVDPSGPVGAEQHPEAEERDEHRQAGARRPEGQGDAETQDQADDEEGEAFVHAPILAVRAVGPRLPVRRVGASPRRSVTLPQGRYGPALCRDWSTPRSASSRRSRSPGALPTGELLRLAEILDARRLRLPRGLGRRRVRRGRTARRREPVGADPGDQGSHEDAAHARGARPVPRRLAAARGRSRPPVHGERRGERDRLVPPPRSAERRREPQRRGARPWSTAGREFDAGLLYGSSRHDALVETARRMPEIGAARIVLDDPAGLLQPHRAGELVAELARADRASRSGSTARAPAGTGSRSRSRRLAPAST